MSPTKISVIVPIYKVEKYLDQCINSLINQTLKDIEIILVDDGSPDNCPNICDKYYNLDNRVKVIHKTNEGLGMARNSGMKIASGEYITFIDSDDWIESNTLEILYKTITKENSDIVYYSYLFYTDSGDIINKSRIKDKINISGEDVKYFILDMVAPSPTYKHDVKYMMSVCMAIFKRNIIQNNNLSFLSERQILSEDLFFQLDYLSKCNKITFIPDCLYYYRINQSSLSHTWNYEKLKRVSHFLNEVENKLKQLYTYETYKNHHQRLSFFYLRTSIYSLMSSNISGKYKLLSQIINDQQYEIMFKEYPYKQMPYKQRLLFFLLKHKLYYIIYTIFYIATKI